MATDVERLIVTLEARTKEYERALLKAQGTTLGALKKIERDMAGSAKRQQAIWAKAGAGIQTTLTRAFAPLAAIAGGALSGRALVDFADSFTKIENSLRVAGVAGADLAGTLDDLFQIASKHGAPVEALGTLYGRLALSQRELNISSEDLIGFTDNVAAALRVSGKSAAEASGALLQLSQALGGGVVRAEEFNSILEGAPAIAQAVARGLTEAGGSVARLRQLVIDGQISSEAFFKAFQLGSVETQRQALLAERTIGQAWENIKTSLTDVIGSLDDATSASRFFADELDNLADDLKETGEEIEAIVDAGNKLAGIFEKLTTLSPPAAEGLGLAGLRTSIEQWEKLLAQAEARGETAAAENMRARIAELEAEIVKGMQSLVGPAFERGGRGSAEAYAAGFKSFSLKDAMANDLGGALEGVLERQKKLFAGISGGGGKGPVINVDFTTTGEAEQLQAIISQREAVAGLTSDLAKLETALSAHFDTPFDDIMGFGAADAAKAAFAQAIIDLEALSQRFIDGQVSAQAFDDRVAGIKARLESLAGVGNELDPFIDDMLKATSVAGQLQSQLTQTQNAIKNMGGGFTSQSFNVPKVGGGTQKVEVVRPVAVERNSVAEGVKSGSTNYWSSMQQATQVAQQHYGASRVFYEASKTQLGTINGTVEKMGANITNAVGQQTNALTSAFDRGFGAIAGTLGGGPGQFGGSLGSSASVSMDFSGAGRAEMDALNAEANILQTGLQYKQLSAEETKASELRLAEIAIETAKLQQRIVEYREEVEFGIQQYKQFVENTPARYRSGNWNPQQELELMLGFVGGFAGGGEVRGPGGPKSDTVPIMASAGEFVVNAASTKKHRALLDAINGGRIVGMADGGIVGRLNGTAQRLANGGMVAPAAGPSRGDISLNLGGVHVTAQDGRVSRESTRDAGRQVASQVAYHLREMGVI